MPRMRHAIRFLALALSGLGATALTPSAAVALPQGTKVQIYEADLNFPVDAITLPGRATILFTEKNSGKIRVVHKSELLEPACAAIDVSSADERGLLGITVDPGFATNHYIYVYYTTLTRPRENRIDRFTYQAGQCVDQTPIVGGLVTGRHHNAGQLEFLDGKLFVSVGDGYVPSRAQDLTSTGGKILRYNPDGSIPDDNPFNEPGDDSPVWSYGHRNGFGLAVNPETGLLYESENGTTCDDELNLITEGENYGWGDGYVCGTDGVGDTPTPPISWFQPRETTVAPTDAWWYRGRMDGLSDSLYVGDYKNGFVHRFDMTEDGTEVERHRLTYDNPTSPVLDVFKGPGGWLYFMTPTAIKRIVPTGF